MKNELLFIALMLNNQSMAWRAPSDSDGEIQDGYFFAGMRLPTGGKLQMKIPRNHWFLLDHSSVSTLAKAIPQDDLEDDAKIAAWIINGHNRR